MSPKHRQEPSRRPRRSPHDPEASWVVGIRLRRRRAASPIMVGRNYRTSLRRCLRRQRRPPGGSFRRVSPRRHQVSITKVPPVRSAQAHVRTAHPPLPGGSGCAAPAPKTQSYTGRQWPRRSSRQRSDGPLHGVSCATEGWQPPTPTAAARAARTADEPLCCSGVLLFDQPLGGHDQPHHQNRRSRRTTSSSRRLTLMVAILPSDVVRLIA